MSKVFLVVGKSFSGKDTFINILLSDKEFCEGLNLHRFIRHTTRKKREHEVEGKHYYFIDSIEEYKDKPNCVIERFNTKYEVLHYVSDFSNLDPNKNYITTASIDTIDNYKSVLGDNLYLIFLLPPNWVLMKRFCNRVESPSYEEYKCQEIYRRFMNDMVKFAAATNHALAMCNSTINLGEKLFIDNIKNDMYYFVGDMTLYHTSFIYTENDNTVLDTHYTPKYKQDILVNAAALLSGNIPLNDIILNTETSSIIRSRDYQINL